MSKKIGILTYHHVANWGSVLQAVCLSKLLHKIYPNDQIELVDYTPQTSTRYIQSNLYEKNNINGFSFKVKNKEFRDRIKRCKEFLEKNVAFSVEKLVSDDVILGREFIEKQNYDKIFVGSDTVFQLGPYSGSTYIAAPQPPNLYFLPFDSKMEKIGVSVSVDPFRPEQLIGLDKSKIHDCLEDFKMIFFRDKTTHDVLSKLNISQDRMDFVPDPSLLVDFDLICRDDSFIPEQNNLVAVAVGNGILANELIKILIAMNYTPINLLGTPSNKGVISTSQINSIDALINLHKRFKLVITDRFHGSIKALVMGNCPIIGIEDSRNYPVPNSKIRDLYERFGLSDMIIRYENEEISSKWLEQKLEKWNSNKIEILNTICDLRKSAFDVLRKAL